MIFRVIQTQLGCLIVIFLAGALSKLAVAQEPVDLVDIRKIDRTIVIDLRYAGANNIAGHPLYPTGTAALVRPDVARRLVLAQTFLRRHKYGLKIWDAYRPRPAQLELWKASRSNAYVADPETTNGSMHSWGLAVDATLVDARKREVRMPTDFDDFTPAAMWRYQGTDPIVRANLVLLQVAMREGGFYGLRTEWWHFVTKDWKDHVPDPDQFATRPSSLSDQKL
jgi:D-alanyl-D-alanine dipeptidase